MDNILGLFEKLESQSLAVQPSRCVVVRNRNASCRRCAEACPTGAIRVEGNDLAVAPEHCVGCGTCATVCPTAALESKKPDDKELLRAAVAAMQANDGAAVIMDAAMQAVAEGKYDPAKVVVVKSLGRVDESLIAVLAAGGATSIVLVAGPVEDASAASDRTAQLVCDTAALLLETWGSDVSVKLTSKLPRSVRRTEPAEFDTGRRGFFSSVRDEARAAAAITAEHVVREKLGAEEPEEPKFAKVAEDGTLPHFLPERRGRLLLALSNLGSPEDVMIDTRLFGHVIIDGEKCTSCQMCATFCPTEAIRKFGDAATAAETGKPFGIDHYTGRCVQCHCCEDICPTGALTLSTDVFATDVTKRGRSERIPMKPRKRKVNDPKSIVNAMSDLLGVPNVYER
ncbi:4Fe-4S binding protein [Adlercreutzia equolifaciens]|uniref:4Fe-4S binding protein n=1 Tax=Adlercreutzia equolifaciens TaxID=446660 RepID=UPI001CC53368|nr:4Fe-4S binding protein [Adlercreutzia equolifaciens]GJC74838.1 polyferredoxin [Adlercreutzia equolifaciens]